MSTDSIVLEGLVRNAVDADRADQIAETYAPGKVVNLLSIGSSQQVMLEVRFAEVKRSALKQIGLNWDVLSDSEKLIGTVGNGVSPDAFGVISRAFRGLGENFNVTLDALERKGVVTTLAEPTLVALSGETASFLAGGEFPIPISQGLDSISIEYKQYGVGLAFTPVVLADGRISMRVRPEVSELSDAGAVKLGGYTVPALTTRRAETTVELGSGQSLMIGGLLSNTTNNSIDKAPFLGDLPILGSLFRSTKFKRDETELVIIVTPYLVRPVSGRLALPTDGYRAPSDPQRVLEGQTYVGQSGIPASAPVAASGAVAAPGFKR
jgi:pilus assembly protein CpaC